MTAVAEDLVERSPRTAGFAVTAAVHATVLVLVIAWGSGRPDEERPVITPERVMHTQLVALGKRPSENALPRFKKPPAPPREATHLGEVNPETSAVPQARRDQPEVAGRSMQEVIEDLKRERDERGDEDQPAGSEHGSVLGTSTTGRLQAVYGDRVKALLEGATSYALVPPDELGKLSGSVALQVGPDGKILTWEFGQRSGNAHFDESVARSLAFFGADGPRSFGDFPPDSGFGDTLALNVTFKPSGRR